MEGIGGMTSYCGAAPLPTEWISRWNFDPLLLLGLIWISVHAGLMLLVARLITPMIAAYFLKAHGAESHGEGWLMDRYMAVLRWSLDERRAIAHRARGGWRRFTSVFLDHRMWTVGFGFLAFIATIAAFATLPMTFQPVINTDFSQVKIETVPGSTLAQTTAITRKVADMLAADSDVVEAAFADIETTSADIFLTLKKDRPMTSVEWERKIAPKFQTIADARVNFQSQSGGGFGRDIILMFGSDDPVKLEQVANQLVAEMARVPELRAPRVQGDMQRPEIIIRPRLDLAASLGVTTAALSQSIRIATIGDIDQNSARFSLADRQIPIRVAVAEELDRLVVQSRPVLDRVDAGPQRVLRRQLGCRGPQADDDDLRARQARQPCTRLPYLLDRPGGPRLRTRARARTARTASGIAACRTMARGPSTAPPAPARSGAVPKARAGSRDAGRRASSAFTSCSSTSWAGRCRRSSPCRRRASSP